MTKGSGGAAALRELERPRLCNLVFPFVVVVVVFFLWQLNSFAHTSVGSPNYSD